MVRILCYTLFPKNYIGKISINIEFNSYRHFARLLRRDLSIVINIICYYFSTTVIIIQYLCTLFQVDLKGFDEK